MRLGAQRGFTITEMLVSLGIFSIFSLGVAGYLTQTFKRLGSENRASLASMELRNALGLLASELRMGTSVSPYLPGDNPALVTCGSSLNVTANTVRFLVVHDDATAMGGIRAYYVGYRYDPATRTLLRGEILSASTTSCSLPAGDPSSPGVAQVLARNVTAVGSTPVFSFAAPVLSVNLAIRAGTGTGNEISQKVSTQIAARVS